MKPSYRIYLYIIFVLYRGDSLTCFLLWRWHLNFSREGFGLELTMRKATWLLSLRREGFGWTSSYVTSTQSRRDATVYSDVRFPLRTLGPFLCSYALPG